jgi:hypothetical protein
MAMQVFPDAGALAEAACAAAYACPADSDWPQLAALLGHAASALRRSQQEPQAAGRSSAADDDGWDDWEDAAGAADGPAGADVGPRLEEVWLDRSAEKNTIQFLCQELLLAVSYYNKRPTNHADRHEGWGSFAGAAAGRCSAAAVRAGLAAVAGRAARLRA